VAHIERSRPVSWWRDLLWLLQVCCCSSMRLSTCSAMAKARGTTPARRHGAHGALGRTAGYTSHRDISDELNRLKVPTARGGEWHVTTVARLLARLR
jgi:hypothetical protein